MPSHQLTAREQCHLQFAGSSTVWLDSCRGGHVSLSEEGALCTWQAHTGTEFVVERKEGGVGFREVGTGRYLSAPSLQSKGPTPEAVAAWIVLWRRLGLPTLVVRHILKYVDVREPITTSESCGTNEVFKLQRTRSKDWWVRENYITLRTCFDTTVYVHKTRLLHKKTHTDGPDPQTLFQLKLSVSEQEQIMVQPGEPTLAALLNADQYSAAGLNDVIFIDPATGVPLQAWELWGYDD